MVKWSLRKLGGFPLQNRFVAVAQWIFPEFFGEVFSLLVGNCVKSPASYANVLWQWTQPCEFQLRVKCQKNHTQNLGRGFFCRKISAFLEIGNSRIEWRWKNSSLGLQWMSHKTQLEKSHHVDSMLEESIANNTPTKRDMVTWLI